MRIKRFSDFRAAPRVEAPMRKRLRARLAAAALWCAALGSAPAAAQLEPAFTYQGRLEDAGQPKNTPVDLRFTAYTVESGGAPIAPERIVDAVPVVNGIFDVKVDLGSGVFLGDRIFVEIAVREDAVGDATVATGFTALAPRQEVTPAPYALHAERVAFDAVTGQQIANGTIGTADVADGSITASDVETESTANGLQRRLAFPCPAGQAMQNISSTGAPTCYQPVTSVVAAPGAGLSVSNTGGAVTLTLDENVGQSRVQGECQEVPPSAIRKVHGDGSVSCVYLAPTTPLPRITLDAAGDVGSHLSLRRGDSLAVISVAYYDDTNNRLKFVHCDRASCNPAPVPVVIDDPANDVGQFVSVGFRSIGPVMAYYDATAMDLKLAACGNAECTSANTIRTIDTAGDVGRFAEIVLFSSGYGIAYFDATNNQYKWAFCSDHTCTTPQIRSLGIAGGGVLASDLATARLQNELLPTPSFVALRGGSEVVLVTCGNAACTSLPSPVVIASGDVGPPLLLAIESFAGQRPSWIGFGTPAAGSSTLRYCVDGTCVAPVTVGSANRPVGPVRGTAFALRDEGGPLFLTTGATATQIVARRLGALDTADRAELLAGTATASAAIDSTANFGGFADPGVEIGIVYHESASKDLVYQPCLRTDCSELW